MTASSCSTAAKAGLGPSPASTLTAFFSQHINGLPRIPQRAWLDRWSWVAALSLRFWVSGATSPAAGQHDARLLLLEELRQGRRAPARVVLEVRGERAADDAPPGCVYFDAAGGYAGLTALMMAYPQALLPMPLRWIPTLDEDLRLAPNEQRAWAAGIVHNRAMSVRLAQALAHTYGPFSSDWLAAVRGCGAPW